MRLWSIHPSYLDGQGLLGLWRESLLAQKVLAGQTNKYKNHPQLIRFNIKNNGEWIDIFLGTYLYNIYLEATSRKYKFDKCLIFRYEYIERFYNHNIKQKQLTVTNKQLEYEFNHLQNKLWKRNKMKYWHNAIILDSKTIKPHPLFKIMLGEIEQWEKIK